MLVRSGTTYILLVPRQHYRRHLNPWEAAQSQCSQWWLYSPQHYCYKIRELRDVRKVRTSCIMHHTGMNTIGLFSWKMNFEPVVVSHDCSLIVTIIQWFYYQTFQLLCSALVSGIWYKRTESIYLYMKWTTENKYGGNCCSCTLSLPYFSGCM